MNVGRGVDDGLRGDLLLQEEFYPVCAPTLLSQGPRLRKAADLARHVLLHASACR